jgi:PIN domain nuclease of toxin-antitoxin system
MATLSASAANLLGDLNNQCLISPVNHWEMAMKISIGKYQITDDFEAMWRDVMTRFAVLPIEPRHTARLIALPFHHKDPFDRLLVAQALAEDIPLISSDKTLDAYGVERLW